jgi:1-acyl-sn-glycerol-3-phosphate acyltransferase
MILNLIIVMIYLLFYLNFLIGLTFSPIILIHFYFHKYDSFINIFKNIVWSSISYLTYILLFKNVYVNSNKYIKEILLNEDKSNIIISNHISDLDFLLHTFIFTNSTLYSKNIGIAKKNVGYQVPICGFFGLFTGDIFLHRKIEYDIDKLYKKINFNNLLIFPEGTCFNDQTKKISDDYCDKNKLIKYNYLLYPRITGIKTIIKNNKNIKCIYDFTIIYDKITPNKYGVDYNVFTYILNMDLLPNKVFIKINKYKIKTDMIIEKQIENIYLHNNKFIEEFDINNNKYIPIKYNYSKSLVCFIGINLLTLISIYLFIKFNFIKYIYTLEFLLYYIYFLFI